MNEIEYYSINIFGAGEAIYCGRMKHPWLNWIVDVGRLSIF
jgi:hypothetical protein